MQEFMMLFRHTPQPENPPTQEEIEATIKQWQDWIGGIAAQGKFASTNQLSYEGKVVQPGQVITDGPYAEIKEIIGGYVIVKATDLDEAVQLAAGCPVLAIGGNVEVRSFMQINL
ncbi:MAG: YciI family protein [Bacteroidota bacterium]